MVSLQKDGYHQVSNKDIILRVLVSYGKWGCDSMKNSEVSGYLNSWSNFSFALFIYSFLSCFYIEQIMFTELFFLFY